MKARGDYISQHCTNTIQVGEGGTMIKLYTYEDEGSWLLDSEYPNTDDGMALAMARLRVLRKQGELVRLAKGEERP